ncbi:MAG: flagellar motor switch protein FliG, partial [Burkholderiales bacterium]
MSADGVEKGAILLMSLGEEVAAPIFQHLAPREVQKLGQAMAGLKNITRESINAVVNDFRALAGEKTNVGLDSLQ